MKSYIYKSKSGKFYFEDKPKIEICKYYKISEFTGRNHLNLVRIQDLVTCGNNAAHGQGKAIAPRVSLYNKNDSLWHETNR